MAGEQRPNSRELNVLEKLCLGQPLPLARLAGAGAKTFEFMVEKGWIERTYYMRNGIAEDAFQITDVGNKIWDDNYKRHPNT